VNKLLAVIIMIMMKDDQRSDENTRGQRVQNAEPNLRVVVTYAKKISYGYRGV